MEDEREKDREGERRDWNKVAEREKEGGFYPSGRSKHLSPTRGTRYSLLDEMGDDLWNLQPLTLFIHCAG